MKITYSFREFYDEVKQLSESKGISQPYQSVRCNFDPHNGLIFSCYAHGYNWYEGKTPEEAIAKLKQAMYPVSPEESKDDIEIESTELNTLQNGQS